ncbi:MAG: SGNH/GDSL hydrolase family protein [Mesorhizobium sp.]|uniref:SGNH/GDSL hydrolase family protein n=1 Tax=Mesorhizobium sp. TaxID=1871066 RepID=UPI000FE88320|nr:SGNH/GDSL hydrolase family protein [Mesorhizobium sp.]RWM93079.1 MAG: SGNH/GDSL hydrolase family protein [Mesorhizobium sp.]
MSLKTSACATSAKAIRLGSIVAVAASAIALSSPNAAVAAGSTWVKSWTASPQPTWDGDFPLPTLLPFNLWNQTVRQKVRVSLGGDKLRIVLSNEYGKAPLVIDSVHVALTGADGSAVETSTDKLVTFSGSERLSIPAGAPAISDPVELNVPARGDVVVSIFVADPTPIDTFHWDAEETGYIGPGNQVENASIDQPTETTTRLFLSDVFVEAPAHTRAVVAFGDSITDGAASGLGLNSRWPDFLAENLAPDNVAVLNAGISGARLLNTQMGENAMARFFRDVLSVPNLETVVVLIGINDIAWPGQAFGPDDPFLSREQIIAGYRQLIAMAHAHNLRIVAGTLTPFQDALKGSPLEGYYSLKRDELREEINNWIRASDEFDAVVDLDKLLVDPENPVAIRADLQADHLHLSPKGNKMVADALTAAVLFSGE